MISIIIIIIILFIIYYHNSKLNQNFYQYQDIYPELNNINNYQKDIFIEFFNLLQSKQSWIPWAEKDLYNHNSNNDWTIFPLYVFGTWHKQNIKLMPKLTSFLQSLPNLKIAILSKLGPHTTLKHHQGWKKHSNHVLRCHYGLIVPNNCYIYVKDDLTNKEEIQYHKLQDWIVFDDSKTHSATNDSNQDRYVLIIDLDRPSNVKSGQSNIQYSQELLDLVNEFHKTNV